MSVRETEALVEEMKQAIEESKNKALHLEGPTKTPLAARFSQLSKDLGMHWSAKVEIKGSDQRGKIVIHYSSRQELDRLVEDMQTKRI